jgi:hypothetical protein
MQQWVCPPFEPLSLKEEKLVESLYDRILTLKPDYYDPIAVVGLEIRTAMMLLEFDLKISKPDNAFWQDKCRSLFARPASEPILLAYWREISTFEFSGEMILSLAAALSGQNILLRDRPIIGLSRNGDVEFEPASIAIECFAKITSAAHKPEFRSALPMLTYAQMIMSHPLSDANGRVARVFVQLALANFTGLPGPIFAIAPAFYRRANELRLAFDELNVRGDWSPFFQTFTSIIEDSVEIHLKFLDHSEKLSHNQVSRS